MPERFGDYKLIQKIAEGGMAEIFLAKRVEELGGFEKRVALKRIFRHLTSRRETINMFLDEARIAASLNHPNIVQVFDLGEVDGHFYIAMEFVHGTDLRRICRRGLEEETYPPLAMAARFVAEAAGGLHYAHTRRDAEGRPKNIVHRDVSPQNLLVSMEGHVKVCDFGIAKAENRLARTETGEFKGKLAYMSPEQFGDAEVDARSDVFNLGIVLYEVAMGQRLFEAPTDFELMRKVAEAEVTPPSEQRDDFPPGLESIILRALASNPGERFQSAEAMQRALEEWLRQQGVRVSPVEISDFMADLFPELVGGPPREMGRVDFPTEEETRGGIPMTTEHVDDDGSPTAERAVAPEQPPTEEVQPPAGLQAPEPRTDRDSSVSVNVDRAPDGPEPPDRGEGAPTDETTLDEMDQQTREVEAPAGSVADETGQPGGREDQANGSSASTESVDTELGGGDATRPTPIREGSGASSEERDDASERRPRPSREGARDPQDRRATAQERPALGAGGDDAGRRPAHAENRREQAREIKPDRPSPSTSMFQRIIGWIMEPLSEDDEDLFGRNRRRWAAIGLVAALVLLALFIWMIVSQTTAVEKGDKGTQVSPDAVARVDTGSGPSVETVGVELRSKPSDAHVVVNASFRGQTPGTFELVDGEKNEIYLFKRGYATKRTFVEASSDADPDPLELTERDGDSTAKLLVESNVEGADVVLDGRSVGQTPLTLEEVAVGRHAVRVTADGKLPYTAIVDVAAGRKNGVGATLPGEDLVGTGIACDLVYDFIPQGTQIQIDGEIVGNSRMESSGECGRFRSVLGKLENYEVVEHDVHMREPGRYVLQTRLQEYERLEGTLDLEVPDGVTVYLAGSERGEGDLRGVELPEGNHEVVLTGEAERFNGEVTVEPDQTSTYRATFSDGEWSMERLDE